MLRKLAVSIFLRSIGVHLQDTVHHGPAHPSLGYREDLMRDVDSFGKGKNLYPRGLLSLIRS